MLELLVLVGRALALACRGHHELVLENMALRQQLRAGKRTTKHPHLRTRDRLFWIVLARLWRNWRTALVLVQQDTVVRWHRDWLCRRWIRRSKPGPDGRPSIDQHAPSFETLRPRTRCGEHSEFMASYAYSVSTSQNALCRAYIGTASPSAVADMADVLHRSSRRGRAAGFLHRPDAHRPGAVRPPCCRISVGALCTSKSRIIRRQPGPLNK